MRPFGVCSWCREQHVLDPVLGREDAILTLYSAGLQRYAQARKSGAKRGVESSSIALK
jgi:hypothetical protein